MSDDHALVPVGYVERRIIFLRGERVILDSELAALYSVTTTRLNQQVRRNIERFPEDFMFQLTSDEHSALMLQFATSKIGRGGRRKLPYVFTEHGAIMAASVLNSERAVKASISVVRAFVSLRRMLVANKELAQKLAELERKIDRHDRDIVAIMHAIRELMAPPPTRARKTIGFRPRRG